MEFKDFAIISGIFRFKVVQTLQRLRRKKVSYPEMCRSINKLVHTRSNLQMQLRNIYLFDLAITVKDTRILT